jgi:hypothetical protein
MRKWKKAREGKIEKVMKGESRDIDIILECHRWL